MNNFKVSISSNTTAESWGGYFESEAEANEWLDSQKLKEGRRESRVVSEPLMDVDGNVQVDVDDNVVMHDVNYPAEAIYSVVNTSLEAQRVERLKNLRIEAAQNSKHLEFGKLIIALVGKKNEDKSLTHEQKNAMMTDSSISIILNMLSAGRIGYSRSLIEAYIPDGVSLTQSDKEEIIQLLNDYLAA